MDFNFFQQADQAAFEFEKAKRNLEDAKASLERAKQIYDEIMIRADESCIPKNKFKKIIDERVAALFESGLANSTGVNSTKPERPKRVKRSVVEVSIDDAVSSEPTARSDSDEIVSIGEQIGPA
jgi:hypothetical protein